MAGFSFEYGGGMSAKVKQCHRSDNDAATPGGHYVVFYLGSAKEGVMLILDALISALSCLNKVIPVTCWSE